MLLSEGITPEASKIHGVSDDLWSSVSGKKIF